jgi:glycosyltransferase involved in cell wall biosynthesis
VKLAVIIPAYNEEKYLPATLDAINGALKSIQAEAELIVVDNESTDTTHAVAESRGARVVREVEHNIAKVRNTGAKSSTADVLVFIDADTIVRPGVFENICEAMKDERCFGGGVAVEYEKPFERVWIGAFLWICLIIGRWTKMRGGACLFCRRDIFEELGGFDSTIYVGEDIDFHWRLDKLATSRGGHTALVETPIVMTSSRRWNQMNAARLLFFTHPAVVLTSWRVRGLWKDWYERPIR